MAEKRKQGEGESPGRMHGKYTCEDRRTPSTTAQNCHWRRELNLTSDNKRVLGRTLYIPLIMIMLNSCSKDPAELYYEDQRYYYDLPSFIRSQAENLQNKSQWVRKHVTKDGHSHIIERGNIDWQEELDAFLESDINRPAWRGEFKVDTISLERVYVITYKTENKQIPVKNVVTTIDKDT